MMILDAILSIQAGDNPRVLSEKLEAFVAPADRGQSAESGSSSAELREAA
jgi:chemotaxis protein MotA